MDSVTLKIIAFLREIGLTVESGSLPEPTFLPGLTLHDGALIFDESRLLYPGDLLHEAGHAAVVTPDRRRTLHLDVGINGSEEMMAIAWSYAAALHLEIDPAVVFHPAGYHGGSDSILTNFSEQRYFGVPMLEWSGMTYDKKRALEKGVLPYPHMLLWLRPEPAKTAETPGNV
jgi:hypothetical protein